MTRHEPSRQPSAGHSPSPEPWFKVVAGHPSDEELAALAVALATVAADRERQSRELAPARGARPARGWARRPQLLRAPLTRGPDAWRCSSWPG